MQASDRTQDARDHDDRELIEDQERAPGQSTTSGGDIARDVGSRDEEARATGEDAGVTRVQKDDKADRFNPTRADNEGAGS